MTVTYDTGNLTGTWATDVPIEFYTVKAATEFALYWLEGGASSGLWSTEHLTTPNEKNQPTISHLSGWNPLGDPPNPVPEPSTFLLLGGGLMGLAAYSRKRMRQ